MVVFSGELVGSTGEGKLYIPLYQRSFKEALGTEIHSDTINLVVPEFDEFEFYGKRIEIPSPGSWLYPIHCIPSRIIFGTKCYNDSYVVLPRIRKHLENVVQLISSYDVRRQQSLGLGDELFFEIDE